MYIQTANPATATTTKIAMSSLVLISLTLD
jgi:hypothetical protein